MAVVQMTDRETVSAEPVSAKVPARRRPPINETGQIRRELDAKAADDAVWIALHLVQRAGWPDLVEALAAVKAQTVARRSRIENTDAASAV